MQQKSKENKDPSNKFYEVLLDEYLKLGIISSKQLEVISDEMDKEFRGLDWSDFKMNDWIQSGRMALIRKKLHELLPRTASNKSESKTFSPTALCFSGGGIRSATYCLGVLQGLAKFGLLDKFDYLSTVSGGGYIGSWLSAWIDRAGSVEKVQAALCKDETNPYLYEMNDFIINFDDVAGSLRSIPTPIKLDLEGTEGLSSEERLFIEQFEAFLNDAIKTWDLTGDARRPADFELKIEFKKFCRTLNRILLRKKELSEVQHQQFYLKLDDDFLETIKSRRRLIDQAIFQLLRMPYLLSRRDFKKAITVEDLVLEKESAKRQLSELQAKLDNPKISIGEYQRKKLAASAESKNEDIELLRELIAHFAELPTSNDAKPSDSFIDSFIFELNRRMGLKSTHILRIKERRRISSLFGSHLNPYVESEMLQNIDTANRMTEAEEITHLRSYSNYMSPKLGLFSTDTLALVGLYLRNLFLNWLVFVPIIAALLLVPKIFVAVLNKQSFPFQIEKLFPVWLLSFLPFDRADIANLINYLSMPWTDYGMLLLLIGLTGVFGIHCINYLRPSLGSLSRVEQNYKVDEIGIPITFESQIFKYCFLPIVAIAFWLPIFMRWQQSDKFVLNHTKYEFVLFGVSLFLGGFVISRLLMFADGYLWSLKGKEREAKFSLSNNLWELGIALGCGALGGAILYLFTERSMVLFLEAEKLTKYPNLGSSLFVVLSPPLFLLAFLVAATMFIGVASRITDDMDREWMTRFGAMLLKVIFGWLLISSIVLLGENALKALTYNTAVNGLLASIGGISGVLTLVLGFSSSSTEEKPESVSSWKSMILGFAPQIAAPVFIIFLTGLIAWLTDKLMNYTAITNPWIWFFLFGLFGALMGLVININKFSLHAMYRERLIRAYLGASRLKERFKTANSFTDLDLRDNVEMKYLLQKPYHVVNMTLNLVKTQNLKWQNRKAESFTASALFCGSSNMGNGTGHFRRSKTYGVNEQNDRSITLGTAAAISGAAASPNMGYFTVSSAVTFLMTLFNIRLGWWLGNPGNAGKETYKLATPNWSPQLLFAEATGGTTDTYPYIYLSDGGHFENLGLYEMVLRRCKLIVAIDSGCDPKFTFSDLGNAIHKIRVDMGVPINFINDPVEGSHCTVANIRYSEIDGNDESEDGVLVYLKPTLDGSEPIDIKQYKFTNKTFPHESTADQMYSETQFESYRTLGIHAIQKICTGPNGQIITCKNLGEFHSRAEDYMNLKKNKNDSKIDKV